MIYADLNCFHEKMHSCQNNLEKSYTEKKKTKHTPSGYSLFTNCSSDAAKNILDCCRGKDCMEKFCKDLREHDVWYICNTKLNTVDDDNNKKHQKIRDLCHYTGKFREAIHSICNLRYKTPKKKKSISWWLYIWLLLHN